MPKRKSKLTNDQRLKEKQKLTLDYLIANITPENRHPEIDFGTPVGNEIW